jgi:hypothetical protein
VPGCLRWQGDRRLPRADAKLGHVSAPFAGSVDNPASVLCE